MFVLCPTRSGSTLLRCLLNAHPLVCAPHELHLTDLGVTAGSPYAQMALDVAGLSVREVEHLLWDRLLHRLLSGSGKAVLVVKTPSSVLAWERLAEAWPRARWVFLVRHPANVYASAVEAGADRGQDELAVQVLRYLTRLEQARAGLSGPTVRYEDLTADPVRVTHELCDFLQVPWEERMLSYGAAEHGPFLYGIGDWGPKIRAGGVVAGRELPPAAQIPGFLVPICQAWGYLGSGPDESPVSMPAQPYELAASDLTHTPGGRRLVSLPRLIMTACVKDEQDVIRGWLDYHLARGVARILVRDTGSADLTLPILREYAAGGRVSLIEEPRPDFDQSAWVTDLAAQATSRHHADFVLHGDADEFWWPAEGNLATAFAQVAGDVAAVAVRRWNFLLAAEETGRWWERLQARDLRQVNYEGRPLHPKHAHRGLGQIVVDHGAMGLSGPGCAQPWTHPGLEILHFPARTRTQLTRKVRHGTLALDRTAGLPPGTGSTWRTMAAGAATGLLHAVLDQQCLDSAGVAATARAGTVVRDERLSRFLTSLHSQGRLGRSDLAVIIPVAGQHQLTRDLLADLRRDSHPCTVYIVDNGGDYQPVADEHVLRPGKNLHWSGGCNLGLLTAQDQGHLAYVLCSTTTSGSAPGSCPPWPQHGTLPPAPGWSARSTTGTGPSSAPATPAPPATTVPPRVSIRCRSWTALACSSRTPPFGGLGCSTNAPGPATGGAATRITPCGYARPAAPSGPPSAPTSTISAAAPPLPPPGTTKPRPKPRTTTAWQPNGEPTGATCSTPASITCPGPAWSSSGSPAPWAERSL